MDGSKLLVVAYVQFFMLSLKFVIAFAEQSFWLGLGQLIYFPPLFLVQCMGLSLEAVCFQAFRYSL